MGLLGLNCLGFVACCLALVFYIVALAIHDAVTVTVSLKAPYPLDVFATGSIKFGYIYYCLEIAGEDIGCEICKCT